MSLDESRARMGRRVWQAIAQSGVDLSAVPQADQEKLVGYVTDGALLEVNDMLDDLGVPPASETLTQVAQPAQPAQSASGGEEKVLWEGRPFLSLNERYVITTERVRVITGLLGKAREDIELVRLQDIDHKQGMGERIMNIGDILLHSADSTHPEIVLRNVTDPEEVHEIIRRAMLEARRRYRFSFQDEM